MATWSTFMKYWRVVFVVVPENHWLAATKLVMERPSHRSSLTQRAIGDIRELTRSSFGQIWVCPWYPSCSEEPTAWHCSCSQKVGELSRQQRVLQVVGLLRAEYDSRVRASVEAAEQARAQAQAQAQQAQEHAQAQAQAQAQQAAAETDAQAAGAHAQAQPPAKRHLNFDL